MKKILLTFVVVAFSGNVFAATFCNVAQSESEESQSYTKSLFQGFVEDAKGLTLIVRANGEAVEIDKLSAEITTVEQAQLLAKEIEGAPMLLVKRQENLSYVLAVTKFSTAKSKVLAMTIGQLSNTGLTLMAPKYAISCVDMVNPAEVTNKPEPVK